MAISSQDPFSAVFLAESLILGPRLFLSTAPRELDALRLVTRARLLELLEALLGEEFITKAYGEVVWGLEHDGLVYEVWAGLMRRECYAHATSEEKTHYLWDETNTGFTYNVEKDAWSKIQLRPSDGMRRKWRTT